ncbi:transposase, partial [Streptomyces erythrochromogenes]|uniref:transposase n=1 Tax=Streptomyces erythrochromogenes TaxID=285574 RepID=UPI0036B0620C
PELAQHLMQAALEAEMDLHLADESVRAGGRGSRSGGNMRNGYRAKKVMIEVGPVVVSVPRDRLGTFRPGLLPRYARRTGALDETVLSLTGKGLTKALSMGARGRACVRLADFSLTVRPWSRRFLTGVAKAPPAPWQALSVRAGIFRRSRMATVLWCGRR